MAKVTTRKKKRTTDSRTGCVTTRCCVECPKPTRRRRRRKLASKSLPLSRAMPMPLPSLQNIMPTPFMPLNVPLPRVEANRRPFGTYQFNNQPVRVQQKSTRTLATMTDNMVRGTTSQKLPITNAPIGRPPPRLEGTPIGRGVSLGRKILASAKPLTTPLATPRSETPPNPFEPLPNILDLQGLNALGVGNQGQNLRQNPGVIVAREELLRSRRQSSFDEGESVSSSDFGDADEMIAKGGMGDFFASQSAFGNDVGALRNEYEEIGLDPSAATREARRILGQQSQSLSQMGGRMTGGTMTMADLPLESSGGAGARIAGDTTTDMSN